jgi:hypothetical protein
VRVVGTIDKLDGNNLTVNLKDGSAVTVVLADNAAVFGVEKRSVADIKPGDFLASGGVKGTDGKIHAVEVRIFPETLRGTGEGQRPWDVKPDGVMTNATVGTVGQSPEGGVIHVKHAASSTSSIRTANPNTRSGPRYRWWLMSAAIAACSSLAPQSSPLRRRNPTAP